MYKLLISSIGAIGLIATTAIVNQLPLSAQLQPSLTTSQAAAKRVSLTLKADKKVMSMVGNKPKISYLPISGKVKQKDIIRYTVTAQSNSQSVTNLALSQKIPRGTTYVKSSATALEGAELLFSIDGGKTYAAKPIIGKKEAAIRSYTNLRWKFNKSIAANTKINATYEVEVN
jgi:uncharacterized repeat protein (TIGR01451 family)